MRGDRLCDKSESPVTSVNDTLARGLRQRLVSQLKNGYLNHGGTHQVRRITCPPTTRKGVRKVHDQYGKRIGQVAAFGTSSPIYDQYGVWVCWDCSHNHLTNTQDRIGATLQLVDFKNSSLRNILMAFSISPHVIERIFQRVGTTDSRVVFAELQPVLMWVLAMGIVIRHWEVEDDPRHPKDPVPFLLPTPNGAILGDILPTFPTISINTYIGGRRDVSATKQRLIADTRKALIDYPASIVGGWVATYFVSNYGFESHSKAREHDYLTALNNCYAMAMQLLGAHKRHPFAMHKQGVRAMELGRSELMWKWARMQEREQLRKPVA